MKIRAAAVMNGVPCMTPQPGCLAVVQALEALIRNPTSRVTSLQFWAASMSEMTER